MNKYYVLPAVVFVFLFTNIISAQFIQTGPEGSVTQGLAYNNDTLYCISKNDIYYSPDKGVSWESQSVNLPENLKEKSYQGSEKFKIFNNTFYLLRNGTLFFSNNKGVYWTPYYQDFPMEDFEIFDGKILAAYYGGLKCSMNNGNTWIDVMKNINFFKFQRYKNSLLASTQNDIYKSIDGLNWNLTVTKTGILDFCAAENIIYILYDVNSPKLEKSSDGGITWYAIVNPVIQYAHAIYAYKNNIFLSFPNRTFYRSTNYGYSFENYDYKFSCYWDFNLYFAPGSENIFLSTSDNNGVYKLNFYNDEWERIDKKFNSLKVFDIARFGKYFAICQDGVATSVNGSNWQYKKKFPINSEGKFYSSLYSIYSCSDGKLSKTTNYGENWVDIDTMEYVREVAVSNNKIYLLNGIFTEKIYKSTDEGNTFTVINSPNNYYSLKDIMYSKNTLYVSTKYYDKLFKSTNDGQNWTELSFNQYFPDMSLMSTKNGIAIFGYNKILYSTNDGNSFSSVTLEVNNFKLKESYFQDELFIISKHKILSLKLPEMLVQTILEYNEDDITSFTQDNYAYYITTANTSIWKKYFFKPPQENVPIEITIDQNYPNPFNPFTNILLKVPYDSRIKITILDMLGRELETLTNDFYKPGYYNLVFNGSKYPSGIYFYRMTNGIITQTKKMVLVK